MMDQAKDVFSWYGRAALAATEFEKTLLNLVGLLSSADFSSDSVQHVAAFTNNFSGEKIKDCPGMKLIAEHIECDTGAICRALKDRDYLMNRFWVEHADEMAFFDLKRKMARELEDIYNRLEEINEKLSARSSKLFLQFGLNEKNISRAVDNIVDTESGSSGLGRCLNSKETVVNCVAVSNPRARGRYVPALQMADGALFIVSEAGLVPGPRESEQQRLKVFDHLARYLPAQLHGPVRALGKWNWAMNLGAQHEVFSESAGDSEKPEVQWGIRMRRSPDEDR